VSAGNVLKTHEQQRRFQRAMTDEREVIRQESFWFTATTLGFRAFVGSLLKSPSTLEAISASLMIVVLSVFTVYLLVGRYRKYCELNNKTFPSW
jgi:hypothetical protein